VTTVRIGTRGSPLALWQARTVAAMLGAQGRRTELVVIKTAGDRIQDAPLSDAGGKGLFVKDIEDALLAGDIDIAVHSAKDMSVGIPDGLGIAAVLPREDPRDAIVLRTGLAALGLPTVALAKAGHAPGIGTGSVRRSAQLAAVLPSARFLPIRGNVDTRLRKLDAEEYDALVLAVAGLKRLGHEGRIAQALSLEACIPAPGQGIIAIEARADLLSDPVWKAIDDARAAASFVAERAVVSALGGGCQLPLGAIAVPDGTSLDLHAIVAAPDGSRRIRRSGRGDASTPAELGARVAGELADAGAIDILNPLR
jgi:hydroxymethylbilane synthase